MSTPKLHLYLITGGCSMAPHILLREAGIPFDKTVYTRDEFIKNGGYPAEFLAINPKGKVPALIVDDEVVTENSAIFTLISQLAPSKNLLGKTPRDVVRAYEWFSYLGSSVHAQGFGPFYRPGRFVEIEDGSLDGSVRAAATQMIRDGYKYIDAKLEGRTWAVGDAFTAVDAYLFVFYRWGAGPVGLRMEEEYPNYARVVGEVSKRESVKGVLRAEGLV